VKSFGIGAGAALLTAMALGSSPPPDRFGDEGESSRVPSARVRQEMRDELVTERLARRLLVLARFDVTSSR
jgi:hypothetical protein